MRFFTKQRLGARQSMTKDGYLIIEDVPIARSGDMLYGPGEIPVDCGPQGYIKISRTRDELHRPETIASFNGKPVVMGHPSEDVTPKTWKDLALGIVLHPRPGTGEHSEFVVADLMITDAQTIDDIRKKKIKEVSCGYDASYVQMAPGVGYQRDIQGNHVALVARGRCGPRCSIGDQAYDHPIDKEIYMAKNKESVWKGIKDAILGASKTQDEAAIEEVLETARGELEEGDDSQEIHIHVPATTHDCNGMGTDGEMPAWFKAHVESNNERFAALEAAIKAKPIATLDAESEDAQLRIQLEAEAPVQVKLVQGKVSDSACLEETASEVLSKAEILAPGIRLPTFDRAAEPKKSLDILHRMRKTALDLAYVRPETRSIIEDLLGGKTYDSASMSTEDARTLFNGAAAAQKAAMNSSLAAQGNKGVTEKKSLVATIADMNKRNDEFWKNQYAGTH